MKPLMKYHVTLETQAGNVKSWGVFPIGESKILDGIYNPETRELSLLFDSVTEQYTPFQVEGKNGKIEVQQRKIDQYYRFRLTAEDLSFFLENYVENNFEFEEIIEKKIIEA